MTYNFIEVMFVDEQDIYQPSVSEALYAQTIGRDMMRYLRDYAPEVLDKAAESEAIRMLEEIRQILDDPDLEDSSCFMKIDAVVSAFLRAGIPVDRHDF